MDEILFNLISSWPGLVAKPDRALLEDSLVLLDFLPPGPLRVIDVGSGGGLPGLPLRLARPDLMLTLLEANQRKAAFLVQAAAKLDLADVEVVGERAGRQEIEEDERVLEQGAVGPGNKARPRRDQVE